MKNKNILLLFAIFVLCTCNGTQQFSWSNYNQTNFIFPSINQNYPAACQSSWALTAADVFNSRMKILRKGASPDYQISPQILLSCDQLDFGCLGGQPLSAFKWIKRNNITDSTCQTYLAKGYTNGATCTSKTKCQTCISGVCKGVQNSKIFSIYDYGTVAGQNQIQEQIKNYGPISCSIDFNGLPKNYTNGIILSQQDNDIKINHHVLIYGWGSQNNVKYWIGKNTWGSNWGQNGTFKIQKGKNAFNVQTRCYWGTPKDTWTNDIRNKTLPSNIQNQKYQLPLYLTSHNSMETPNKCQVSSAFSVLKMIQDYISIQSKGKQTIKLSVQNLLNCGVVNCQNKGTINDVLMHIQKYGVVQQSCQSYLANVPNKATCNNIQNCANCQGSIFDYKCTEVKNFKRWRIKNFNYLSGVSSMKSQLNNGPIVCGLYSSQQFKKYTNGIFSQKSILPKINHYVQIVGYGNQNGKQYWIGRNFWGSSWGQSGFFRIALGQDNLGIQTKCYTFKGFI